MEWILGIGFLVVIIIAWFVFFYPIWNVWASKKAGEAELEQAHKEQKIQIATAEARFNAAEMNKKAAIVEAEAVSAQIEKIGKQLTEHDLYLKWQWIEMMNKRPESSVIYVPTEANLPILEATRMQKPANVEVVNTNQN